MERKQLESKTLAELRQIAGALELSGYQRMKKADLVAAIVGESGNGESAGGSSSQPTLDEADEGERIRTRPSSRRRADDDAGDEDQSDDDGAGDDGAGDSGEGSDGEGHDDDSRDGSRSRRSRSRNRSRSRDDDGNGDAGGDGDERPVGRTRTDPPPYDDQEVREGVLDLLPEGYGFLRVTSYLSGARDVYVSQQYVRRFDLRRGDLVAGPIRRNKGKNDKFPALARVETVEGEAVREGADPRVAFTDFIPVHPHDRLPLRVDGDDPTATALRVVDRVAPIARGQRVLVTAPPQAGRTTLLRAIANALHGDDRHVMVVLVDERPEEVTDLRNGTDAEVVAATFDRTAEEHTQAAELAVQRAMRMVERGRDVVVLLDSLTRLVRAYDMAGNSGIRTPLGGVEAGSVHPVRQLFGAARQVDGGGSLTIVGTALVETGPTDEHIREELATMATSEVRLVRIDDARVWPAVDPSRSATRHVELVVGEEEAASLAQLRATLPSDDPAAALDAVLADLA